MNIFYEIIEWFKLNMSSISLILGAFTAVVVLWRNILTIKKLKEEIKNIKDAKKIADKRIRLASMEEIQKYGKKTGNGTRLLPMEKEALKRREWGKFAYFIITYLCFLILLIILIVIVTFFPIPVNILYLLFLITIFFGIISGIMAFVIFFKNRKEKFYLNREIDILKEQIT